MVKVQDNDGNKNFEICGWSSPNENQELLWKPSSFNKRTFIIRRDQMTFQRRLRCR